MTHILNIDEDDVNDWHSCTRCRAPVRPDLLRFDGDQPHHKQCLGRPGRLPDEEESPLPYMDREEFEFRVWLAPILICAAGMVLLP